MSPEQPAPAAGRPIRFTIVVPTHDRPGQLRVCLRAIARLTYPRDLFDVVVVDDGSRRSPEGEVAEAARAMRVMLVVQAHAGPGGARNAGVSRATGEYIAFLGDDCEPADDWLHALAARFARTPDCLIGGRTINALPENIYSAASSQLIGYLYARFNANPDRARFFTPNNMAVPRERFSDLGGFDIAMGLTGEDRELCHRWRSRGYNLVYAPEAVVRHAHPLGLASFWRQQVGYGRGTCRYRRTQRQAWRGTIAPEPISFYVSLVRSPMADGTGTRAWLLAWLLGLSQIANAAGFLLEAVARRRDGLPGALLGPSLARGAAPVRNSAPPLVNQDQEPERRVPLDPALSPPAERSSPDDGP